MKKISLYLTLFIGALFLINDSVTAVSVKCTYKTKSELNSAAWNMLVEYQLVSKVIDEEEPEADDEPLTQYSFDLVVYNLTSDFYVEITNDVNDETKKLYSTDIDESGKAKINVLYTDQLIEYTFKIIANEQECQGTLIRTIKLTLPLLNEFYDTNICQEIPDFYLCQKYVTKKADYETFLTRADEYKATLIKKEAKKKADSDFFNTLDRYKYIIMASAIVIGGVTIFIVVKKRRSRVI